MIGDAAAILGSRAGEMEAIRDFIMTSNPLTPEAARIRDDFILRWENLGFMDREMPTQAVYDEMKNRENQYWIANRPVTERETAARIVKENKTDPRQTSEGVFPLDERIKNVEQPNIGKLEKQIEDAKPLFEVPLWAKTGAIVAVLAGTALGIAKIVTGLNPLSIAAKLAKRG